MESSEKGLRGEIDSLIQRRDELRVQSHLFNAEVKKQWEQLEEDWKIIKRNIKEMGPVFSKSAENLSKETEPLLKEIKNAYERIRDQLKEAHSIH